MDTSGEIRARLHSAVLNSSATDSDLTASSSLLLFSFSFLTKPCLSAFSRGQLNFSYPSQLGIIAECGPGTIANTTGATSCTGTSTIATVWCALKTKMFYGCRRCRQRDTELEEREERSKHKRRLGEERRMAEAGKRHHKREGKRQ